jgi:hypothetical protein
VRARRERFFRDILKSAEADVALLCILAATVAASAVAQDGVYDPANYAWQAGAIGHAQKMRAYLDTDGGAQPTPPVIPNFEIDFDPSGLIANVRPSGPTVTSQNAFFANLGTNARTCFSCHQPQTGWTVSAASVQARFYASFGTDPIFRLVDGATCPTDNVSSIDAKHQAHSLLLSKGLIRIGLPVAATAEFKIASVDDPYKCNTNPVTGLTSPTTGIVLVYRRPLPARNFGFLSTIRWDGREPSLSSQTVDAALIPAFSPESIAYVRAHKPPVSLGFKDPSDCRTSAVKNPIKSIRPLRPRDNDWTVQLTLAAPMGEALRVRL